MSTTKIDIKDWPAHVQKLGDRARIAAKRGLLSGAMRCIPIMQKRVETAAPASEHGRPGAFNTGNYRMRWKARATERGAMVYNYAPYAGIIEGGRRPGSRMPPLEVMEKWAIRRLGLSEKEAKRAAYPLAKAIKTRGLRPRRVMSGGLGQMAKVVRQEVERELAAELRK